MNLLHPTTVRWVRFAGADQRRIKSISRDMATLGRFEIKYGPTNDNRLESEKGGKS